MAAPYFERSVEYDDVSDDWGKFFIAEPDPAKILNWVEGAPYWPLSDSST